MSAQIHSISLSPDRVKTGGKVEATFSVYAAYGAVQLELRCSNAKVSPRRLSIPAGESEVTQTLTFTRTQGNPGTETLKVTLGGDEQTAEITIT